PAERRRGACSWLFNESGFDLSIRARTPQGGMSHLTRADSLGFAGAQSPFDGAHQDQIGLAVARERLIVKAGIPGIVMDGPVIAEHHHVNAVTSRLAVYEADQRGGAVPKTQGERDLAARRRPDGVESCQRLAEPIADRRGGLR